MSFLSLNFVIFFTLGYVIYWNLLDKHKRFFLIFLSAIFYISFSFKFFFHFLLVIILNYLFIRYFREKKYFLSLSISFNLVNLAFFKYFYFLLESLGYILNLEFLQNKELVNLWISNNLKINSFSILLPLSISYYTFQFISLSVDISRKHIKEKVSFIQICSYSLFFPVLIAGPILRFKEIIFQFQNPKLSKDQMCDGIWLILIGITKKALLASNLGASLFPIISEPSEFSSLTLFLTIYFFAVYLYLDFSGLTDLARGSALLFGFNLPINFKAPFFMNSFGDLWKRWHLTFSFWIRDYIYIPLGGSKKGFARGIFNVVFTFALGGLWHGAHFNFLIWGILTGCYIGIERICKILFFPSININFLFRILYIGVIWLFYGLSWAFFFSPSIENTKILLKKIFSFSGGLSFNSIEILIAATFFAFLFQTFEEFSSKIKIKQSIKNYSLSFIAFLIILLLIQFESVNKDFFYERF